MYLKPKPYQEITTSKEFTAILQNNMKVVVDFYADWCQPCKMISPVFTELATDYKTIKCIKVNVDHSPEICSRCGIKSMPTFHFYLLLSSVFPCDYITI